MKHPSSETPFTALPGLGPKSAAWLEQAGITTVDQLRQMGAVAAFAQVQRMRPTVSLNLLWALEGGLTGACWQDVARRERTRLLLALDMQRHPPRSPP